jgi:hypothetical protein
MAPLTVPASGNGFRMPPGRMVKEARFRQGSLSYKPVDGPHLSDDGDGACVTGCFTKPVTV